MTKVAPRSDLHDALAARVLTRVSGRGIPRGAVEDAVERVLRALEDRQPAPASSFLVAVTARSLPDLASRLRRDLEREGVVILEMGVGSAGQHTVVTLRLPGDAREVLERLAPESGFTMSYLSGVS